MHNQIDLMQVATNPPAKFLRLYHARLPWYIDIEETQPNGITVMDILGQMHRQLYTQIQGKHFWNEELDESDRAGISGAFQIRTGVGSVTSAGATMESEAMMRSGVMRIDFLGMDRRLMLVGLQRGKNGMLEMKLKRVDM